MGISIENIAKGTALVVLNGPKWKEPIGPFSETTREREDRSLHGFILEALAVTPPYVLCRTLYPHMLLNIPVRHHTIMVDTRLFELGIASKDAVEMLRANQIGYGPVPTVAYVPPEPGPENQ